MSNVSSPCIAGFSRGHVFLRRISFRFVYFLLFAADLAVAIFPRPPHSKTFHEQLLFVLIMLPHFVVSRRLKVASGWFSPTEQEESPTILWWTPFTGEGNGSYRTCGESTCFFTENRTLLGNPRVEVIV